MNDDEVNAWADRMLGNTECIFCGTEIEDGHCIECSDTADDLGLDYQELKESF